MKKEDSEMMIKEKRGGWRRSAVREMRGKDTSEIERREERGRERKNNRFTRRRKMREDTGVEWRKVR